MRYGLIPLALMALSPGPAPAADACTGALTADQIRSCLTAPPLTRGIGRRTRGISIEGDQPQPHENSVNLTVNFEFNSAELSNDGMISLDALATALADPELRDARFLIAGHTDAVGSDAYNQRLSEARALAVRGYLAQRHQLDPTNFEVIGFGKTQLYDPTDPTAAINRRVQITKLTK